MADAGRRDRHPQAGGRGTGQVRAQGRVANVRNDCRLVGAVGDAISQSLPAPNKQVDTQFRKAANSIKAGALKCQNWGPGLSKSQTDAFLQDMKDAANNIKA